MNLIVIMVYVGIALAVLWVVGFILISISIRAKNWINDYKGNWIHPYCKAMATIRGWNLRGGRLDSFPYIDETGEVHSGMGGLLYPPIMFLCVDALIILTIEYPLPILVLFILIASMFLTRFAVRISKKLAYHEKVKDAHK